MYIKIYVNINIHWETTEVGEGGVEYQEWKEKWSKDSEIGKP